MPRTYLALSLGFLVASAGCAPGVSGYAGPADGGLPGTGPGIGTGAATVGPGNGTGGGPGPGSGTGGAGTTPGTTGSGGATSLPPTGLPCDVQSVLQARCWTCHGTTPANGAPMSLVTLANLAAKSARDPNLTNAQRATMRIVDPTLPMPPAPNPRLSAAEIQTLTAWVNANAPAGTCGVAPGSGGATGAGGRPAGNTGGATGAGGRPATTGATGGATSQPANGLPCDVQTFLQTFCWGCHGTTLALGAPMSLVTLANLKAASYVNTAQTFAQRAAARIQDTVSPMPPLTATTARPAAADRTAFLNWVNANAPAGTCGVAPGTGGAPGSTGSGGRPATGGATGTGTGGAGGAVAAGLPCDVQAVFTNHCTTCHATTPVSGAPMALVTRANLVAPSFANAAQTFAQRAVMRMQGSPSIMPPSPGTPATGAEITTVNNWVNANYPAGTCGAGGAGGTMIPDPFAVPARCTSGRTWTGGNEGDPLMNPGRACIACHTGGGGEDEDEAPQFSIAGTVYPTAHEPDLCNGVNGSTGAQVVIVDANNRTTTLTPNAAGNFYTTATITRPFHAKVVYQGRERIMTAAQTSGDCNSCHTQNGANGAPGRILLP